MSENPTESKSLIEHVRIIPDHRVTGRCDHLLVDIIVIAIISIVNVSCISNLAGGFYGVGGGGGWCVYALSEHAG